MSERPKRPDPPPLPLRLFATLGAILVLLVVVGFLKEERREWKGYQQTFRELEASRALSVDQRRAAETLPLELRQIVVPELRAVDRCTSCHLAVDDPTYSGTEAPFAYHPDHDVHPFERFGCTVCHQGQGRATSAEAAHGDVPFWDKPMTPLDYVEASCGRCHDASDNPAAPRLAEGSRLFEEAGCRGCHRLDGWGNQLGPDLDDSAHGKPRTPEWLLKHFLDPSKLVPESAMPQYGFSEEEAEALTLFMMSRRMAPVSGYHASRRILESAELGAKLFQAKGCVGCHSIGETGADTGPALDHVVTRRTESWLLAHFRDPQAVSPGTVMPQFGFTDAEAHSLVLFLRRVHEQGPSAVGIPLQLSTEQRGEKLYKRYGCRGCHGPAGEGGVPNRNSESGEQVPPLKYVEEGYTLVELKERIRDGVPVVNKLDPNGPEPPLTMAAFGGRLTESQLDDLVAYLVSLYPEGEELDW
ncbi:MAG: c-type cytochrome [Acidimicrobiia bacterium]|nr:c-type cytochrome [Acidimicrobiia bacterium]MBT8247823.1 c-type cytochrome [Acidimicrobiia bacterium]NNL14812.1 c-type cytochrome [Acidimicrobiia bacterium]